MSFRCPTKDGMQCQCTCIRIQRGICQQCGHLQDYYKKTDIFKPHSPLGKIQTTSNDIKYA